MTGVAGLHPMPAPCPRCTGYGDAHYLTCPTLRLERSRVVGGKCEECWAENRGEGCDWAMCGCSCHDDDQAEEDSMNAEPNWREAAPMPP